MRHILHFLLALYLILFLFSCKEDNPVNPQSNAHINNWFPRTMYSKITDTSGTVILDTSQTWAEYAAFNGMNHNDSLIIEIAANTFIYHTFYDQYYDTIQSSYSLEGNNIKGELYNSLTGVGTINQYTMTVQNGQLQVYLEITYSDEVAQISGISHTIGQSTYIVFPGKVPPDHWLSKTKKCNGNSPLLPRSFPTMLQGLLVP